MKLATDRVRLKWVNKALARAQERYKDARRAAAAASVGNFFLTAFENAITGGIWGGAARNIAISEGLKPYQEEVGRLKRLHRELHRATDWRYASRLEWISGTLIYGGVVPALLWILIIVLSPLWMPFYFIRLLVINSRK